MQKSRVRCPYKWISTCLVMISLTMIGGCLLTALSASKVTMGRITSDGAGKYSLTLSSGGTVAGWLEIIEDPKVSSQEIMIVKAAATDGSWTKEFFRSSNGAWINGVKGPNFDNPDTTYNISQRDGKILFSRDGSRMVLHIDEFAKSRHYDYFSVINVSSGAAKLVPVAVPPGMGTYTGYTNYNSHGVWLENGKVGYTLSEDGRFVIYSIKAFGVVDGQGKTLDALVAMNLETGTAVRIAGYRAMDSTGKLTPGDTEYKESALSSAGSRVAFACDNAYCVGDLNGSPVQRIAAGAGGDPSLVGGGQYAAEESTGSFYPVAGDGAVKTSPPGRGGFIFPFWDGEAGFITHAHLSRGTEIGIVRASGTTPLIKAGQEGLPAGWNFGIKSLSSSHRYSLASADGRSVLLSLISTDGKQDLFLLKRERVALATPPVKASAPSAAPTATAPATPKNAAVSDASRSILLYSQGLMPSADERVVSHKGLNIRIPGGLLANKEELRIYSPGPDVPPLVPGMKQVAMVDIQIGKLTNFSKPLVIEMKYDRTLLDPAQPIAGQFIACYFDEKIGGWTATPFEIDEKREVLVIKTNHLTKWSAYYFLLGYSTYPGNKCTVIYDKNDIKNNSALYENRTGRKGSLTNVPVLVQDIALFVDQAYRSYEQQGLALPPVVSGSPATRLNVFVGDIPESTRNTKSGIISINAGLASKARGSELVNLFRQDCGHELFHEVQAHKYGVSGLTALYYENKSFWLEATAEYAGDVLAWKHAVDRDGSPMSRTKLMGSDIKADYLKYSLLTFETPSLVANARQKALGHEYDSAHFVAFLMQRSPHAQPAVLVNMLNRDTDFVKCFNDYFGQNGKTLDLWLADFAAYFVFDSAGPYPAGAERNSAVDDFKGIRFRTSNARIGQLEQNEITETFRLKPGEPYGAAIALTDLFVNGKTDKENESTAFEIEAGSDKEIRLMVTGKADRAPQKKYLTVQAASAQNEKFLVNGLDKIYMVYAAPNSSDAANVTIKAKVLLKAGITIEPAKRVTTPGQIAEFTARIANGPDQPYIVWDYGDGTPGSAGPALKAAHGFKSAGDYRGKATLYDSRDRSKALAEAEYAVTVRENKPQDVAEAPKPTSPSGATAPAPAAWLKELKGIEFLFRADYVDTEGNNVKGYEFCIPPDGADWYALPIQWDGAYFRGSYERRPMKDSPGTTDLTVVGKIRKEGLFYFLDIEARMVDTLPDAPKPPPYGAASVQELRIKGIPLHEVGREGSTHYFEVSRFEGETLRGLSPELIVKVTARGKTTGLQSIEWQGASLRMEMRQGIRMR